MGLEVINWECNWSVKFKCDIGDWVLKLKKFEVEIWNWSMKLKFEDENSLVGETWNWRHLKSMNSEVEEIWEQWKMKLKFEV